MDVFYYTGPMARGSDLQFIEFVNQTKKADALLLVLTTYGGSPDAAYKIGKYLQSRYSTVSVLVSGLCKSAGTLLAISATDIIFTPYGELGPLDIQLAKTDRIGGLESGLSIRQAFETLESQAKLTFHNLVNEIVSGTGGIVSFQTASHSAAEIVSSLYGPIFARIDPEEVGSRTRAMQIAADYGRRLNLKYQNLKEGGLEFLVQTYSSHGFVIDIDEASQIFERVRHATDVEKTLVDSMGKKARFPDEFDFGDVTDSFKTISYTEIENVEQVADTPAGALGTDQRGGDLNDGSRAQAGAGGEGSFDSIEAAVGGVAAQ